MIQSSAQSHGATSLIGETGQVRPSAAKAKRSGLAGLFASLLAEARGKTGPAGGAGTGTAAERPGDAAAVRDPSRILSGARDSARKAAGRTAATAARTAAAGRGEPSAAKAVLRNARSLADAQGSPARPKANAEDRIAAEETGKGRAEKAERAKKAAFFHRRGAAADEGAGVDAALQGAVLAAAGIARSGANRPASDGRAGDPAEKKIESADAKRKDKRKERIELELYDHRTPSGAPSAEAAAGAAKAEGTSANERKVSSAEADLVVHLREGRAGVGSDDSPRPNSAPLTSFSDALARELRENANADIVRHASLVLKDGGQGLLRLSLRPDTLGAVKIRLEMADNKIAGRILVESDEALKAFEKELASLEQAFRDGGFDGASLELGVSADGSGRGSAEGNGDGGPRPFFSERLASSVYDASLPADRPAMSVSPDTLVNVLI